MSDARYVRLTTSAGGEWFFAESEYIKICQAVNSKTQEWVVLQSAGTEHDEVHLRISEIESFLLSTPENRAAWDQFVAAVNEEEDEDESERWRKSR